MDIYDPIGEALGLSPIHFKPVFIPTREIINIGGFNGKHHTDDAKARISAAHKGKKLSAEHREKVRISKIGTKKDETAREKMRQAKLGKKQSEEHRRKAAATRIGKKKKPYVFKNPVLCNHCKKMFASTSHVEKHLKSKKVSLDFSSYASKLYQCDSSSDS